jgi:hypothetical protein
MSHWRANSIGRSMAFLGLLPLMAACSDAPAVAPRNTAILSVPETVALTDLPEPLSLVPTLPPPASFEPLPTSSTSSTSSTTLGPPPTVPYQLAEGQVAEAVEGNRILMIGDSILASTSPRFGGPMCAIVESYGWAVQIEAEEARHIEFAEQVLDELIPEPKTGDDLADEPTRGRTADSPFDVVMLMLGNNYRGDIEDFATEYEAVLRRLSPLPVVVYTVTEDEAVKAELNDVIRTLVEEFDNVIMVDWAEKSAEEPDELLANDNLHLSNVGRDRLSLFTVAALGKTTVGEPDCLDPVFTAGSAG